MTEDKTMSEVEYTMNNAAHASVKPFVHKAVFNVERFDQSINEHIHGNLTIKINKAMAIQLIKLIDSVDLEPSESFLHAFKCHLSNWLNIRREIIARLNYDGPQDSKQNYHNNSIDDSCR
jgi:hypothetical protein